MFQLLWIIGVHLGVILSEDSAAPGEHFYAKLTRAAVCKANSTSGEDSRLQQILAPWW